MQEIRCNGTHITMIFECEAERVAGCTVEGFGSARARDSICALNDLLTNPWMIAVSSIELLRCASHRELNTQS